MTNDIKEMTNEDLMELYGRTKDVKLKQELTMRYVYLVKIIARQMRNVYISFSDIDDMVNEGIIVLMEAIDNFDVTKNAKFETYASLRIRGSVIDVARKQDWVPRSVRKSVKDIDSAVSALYDRLSRYPTDDEVAQYLDIPKEKYIKLLNDSNLCNVLSLNSVMEDSFQECEINPIGRPEYTVSPQAVIENKELGDTLKRAIEGLKPNEKTVISLYYNEELSIKEIAKVLNLSESRISQIHSKALLKLKHTLTGCEI
ncbi:MAG: FliA/WhiG family RNA polymerase sigma factor [Oscillospiraceae bacterium]